MTITLNQPARPMSAEAQPAQAQPLSTAVDIGSGIDPGTIAALTADPGPLPVPWRRGYDSVDPRAIPLALANGAVIMGYPDFGWSPDDFARYRDAGASIARITQHDPPDWQHCSVLDWQPGAIFDGPSLRRGVIAREAFRPGSATVYSDLNDLPAAGRWLAGLRYNVWAASWPAYPTAAEVASIEALLRPGARLVAIQFRSLVLLDYDESVVLAVDWHPLP